MLPLVALAAVATTCPTEPATAAGLRQAETRWVTAIGQGDSGALECRLARDFVDHDWRGGVRRRGDLLTALQAHRRVRLHLTELDARAVGRMGIVQGLNTETLPDGQIDGAVRFTDVFVWRDRRWQAIAAQETVVAKR